MNETVTQIAQVNMDVHLSLHCASLSGHINIVHYLISEPDCDPLVVDENNRTALHWASYYGQTRIIQLLLHDGRIDIMAKDK